LGVYVRSLCGAVAKAENIHAKLVPGANLGEYTVKTVKRNVR